MGEAEHCEGLNSRLFLTTRAITDETLCRSRIGRQRRTVNRRSSAEFGYRRYVASVARYADTIGGSLPCRDRHESFSARSKRLRNWDDGIHDREDEWLASGRGPGSPRVATTHWSTTPETAMRTRVKTAIADLVTATTSAEASTRALDDGGVPCRAGARRARPTFDERDDLRHVEKQAQIKRAGISSPRDCVTAARRAAR